ncbi:N-formylglutamate amidohydrolase [Youhaiella tibetensis]|uniref:N-formylglutamate amidohydrolase n=1 Tax=Paradevosia tibetensis TaxID=1447062 RepID=A0A5B9DUG9_9HYPH|nr:N-formylglutamate amidohydrolase [Youhaiella tibetensis]AKR57006.1 N-formylglutamate deformylase [Devosia sp. H5989]QEE22014.1 N-formylglutamate amidohydrolase [Youhaiella tibetensis]GGF46119.1 N-formylglutamate amidohydrolase [Youhaiella tibetensis]
MQSDYWDKPAFETIRPRRLTAPLVFNSGHSGRDYPQRFLEMTRLDHLSIRQSEDAFVDELFGRAPHLGTPLLRAHFPRAYLDVNREPWELDPQMFEEPLSDRYNTTSPRVAAGLGTLARVVAENKPIYRDRLTLDDACMRIEGIYLPYHATLQKLLSEALTQFGVAVLVDCHSMPRLARSGDKAAPDIVLGDRYGTACAPVLMDLIETVFTSAGLRVARNRPYAGGYATRTYGRPQYGVHAVQIEISRHLYMNEVTLSRNESFDAVRQLVEKLIFALIGLDLTLLATNKAAAE